MSRWSVTRIVQRKSPLRIARSRYAGLFVRIHVAGRIASGLISNGCTHLPHLRDSGVASSLTHWVAMADWRSTSKSGAGSDATEQSFAAIRKSFSAPTAMEESINSLHCGSSIISHRLFEARTFHDPMIRLQGDPGVDRSAVGYCRLLTADD